MNNLSTVLKHQRERIQMDYRHEEERLSEQNRRLVYDNQKETAFETINHYNEGKQLVLIVAQPGTGKTGVVLETLKQLTTHIDDRCCVETKNIHVISGMNDTDWRKQFQEKMLPSFRENIHHRSILNKHVDEIASITNGILITDECHIASNKNMTISKILRCSGLTDCDTVESRNVRLLDISATPESVAWDIEAWGNKAAIVRLMPGPLYKGFEVMLNENRIREAPLFNDYDVVKDWFKFFEDRYARTTKKYFPVRVTKMDTKMYLRRACVEFNWEIKEHNSNERIMEIDNMMGEIPKKHTIILIKEFWRASKRLVRNNVGGSYEQKPKKRNDSTAAQSTIGRFCDNYEYAGDDLNPDLRPVHYGDKTAIEEYVNWFNNGCDFNLSNYTCTRITSKDGNVISTESKLHYTNFSNLEPVEDNNNNNNNNNRHIPVIISGLNSTDIIFTKNISKQRRIEFIKDYLRNKSIEDNNIKKLYDFINNPNVHCVKTSMPSEEASYKRHIIDVVNNSLSRTKSSLDLKDTDKAKNNWQVFIDEKEHRLCFVIWTPDQSTLYQD